MKIGTHRFTSLKVTKNICNRYPNYWMANTKHRLSHLPPGLKNVHPYPCPVDGPAKSCTSKRMVETPTKNHGMFTINCRISLAHHMWSFFSLRSLTPTSARERCIEFLTQREARARGHGALPCYAWSRAKFKRTFVWKKPRSMSQ